MKKLLFIALLMPGLLLAECETGNCNSEDSVSLTGFIMAFVEKSGTLTTGCKDWQREIVGSDGEGKRYRTNFLTLHYGDMYRKLKKYITFLPHKSVYTEHTGPLVPFWRAVRKFGPRLDESFDAQFDIKRVNNTITITSEIGDCGTATGLSDDEIRGMQEGLMGSKSVKEQAAEPHDEFTKCSIVGKAFLDTQKRTSGATSHYTCTTEMTVPQFNQMKTMLRSRINRG